MLNCSDWDSYAQFLVEIMKQIRIDMTLSLNLFIKSWAKSISTQNS